MEGFIRDKLPVKLEVSAETMVEFEIGFKGIVKVAPPKVITKPRKPDLNVDDIYEY